MYSGIYYGFDPTVLLLIIGVILSLVASSRLKSTFATYSRVRSASGMTGAQAAQRILNSRGLYDVQVVPIAGNLTDHYDPRTRRVCLSEASYNQSSLAAVGVAAHECGHAIQHQRHYLPLVLRSTLVPAANFGSTLAWPIFFLGLILSMRPLLTAGIILFGLAVLFQLVTLPVEINASTRAVKVLGQTGILGSGETSGAKKVLTAAALTYVASLAASILQLVRLIILAGGRRRDD